MVFLGIQHISFTCKYCKQPVAGTLRLGEPAPQYCDTFCEDADNPATRWYKWDENTHSIKETSDGKTNNT